VKVEIAGSFRRLPESLAEVFALVDAFVAKGGIHPSQRFLFDFALEELFTNCVKYNPTGKGGIGITLSTEDGEARISVTDFDADRFDPTTDAPTVDTRLPLEARVPGGLGIHLLKGLLDRIEYEYAHRVSTVHLYKKLE
jgi:anti-sigma regulatory factor (Ser/Thr protein kinase)